MDGDRATGDESLSGPSRAVRILDLKNKIHAGLIVEKVLFKNAKPHPANPRIHPPKGTPEWDALRNSLSHSYFDPLVLNRRNKMLVSGHYRRLILMDEGYESADMVIVDWDEPTHKARMIAANELAGHFEDGKLRTLLAEVEAREIDQAETGLTEERLAALLLEVKPLIETPLKPIKVKASPTSLLC